ncbi:unnamed protein product [Amoebophrya sp. A25]|nr:unnamed protein product [Amoebophrya sp. A25]|eukprot:GSA25T00021666001.1
MFSFCGRRRAVAILGRPCLSWTTRLVSAARPSVDNRRGKGKEDSSEIGPCFSTSGASLTRRKKKSVMGTSEEAAIHGRRLQISAPSTSQAKEATAPAMDLRASCKCGTHVFAVDHAPQNEGELSISNCHCGSCRRHAAAPWAAFLSPALELRCTLLLTTNSWDDILRVPSQCSSELVTASSTSSRREDVSAGQETGSFLARAAAFLADASRNPFQAASSSSGDGHRHRDEGLITTVSNPVERWVCKTCHSNLGMLVKGEEENRFFLSAGLLEDKGCRKTTTVATDFHGRNLASLKTEETASLDASVNNTRATTSSSSNDRRHGKEDESQLLARLPESDISIVQEPGAHIFPGHGVSADGVRLQKSLVRKKKHAFSSSPEEAGKASSTILTRLGSRNRDDAKATGGCYCGACRYSCTRFPSELQHCYCSWCRKMSGGACQTWAPIEDRYLRWHVALPEVGPGYVGEQAPTSIGTTSSTSSSSTSKISSSSTTWPLLLQRTSSWGSRHSCAICGTSLTIVYDDQPGTTWLAAGSYDDTKFPVDEDGSAETFLAQQVRREIHICCLSKPPWYDLPNDGRTRLKHAG